MVTGNLHHDLGIVNTTSWNAMSDNQKCLINVVKAVFPESEHMII
jgi:hypothetical protein